MKRSERQVARIGPIGLSSMLWGRTWPRVRFKSDLVTMTFALHRWFGGVTCPGDHRLGKLQRRLGGLAQ